MILAHLGMAWDAFSLISLVGGLAGIALILAGLFLLQILPSSLRRIVVVTGIGLLVSAALYQAGQARGAHLAQLRQMELALLAEKLRTHEAERITRDLAKTATDHAAADEADKAKLREDLKRVQTHPDARRVCLPRGLARGLRQL